MMKNRMFLAEKCRQNIGFPLLVLLVTLLLCPKVNAASGEQQPNGKVITVSGYVTCKGERIPEVLVETVPANESTVSDKEGKFSIDVMKGGLLTFKKEGYKAYEYIADEPRNNMIVCLLPEDESSESVEQAVKEKQEETEAVIIIKTKKEKKQD